MENTSRPNPTAVDRLISSALAIEEQDALEAGELGFMARAMVLATLPHRKVEGHHFQRKNGSYTLTMLANPEVGLPYGSIPRLLLAWLTSEAVRTKSREIELGGTLSGFMAELGLVPTGGKWGSITRLKNQTERLFGCSISAMYRDGTRTAIMNKSVASKALLWWDDQKPEQAGQRRSSVLLTEEFFAEVTDRPVPIDLRAIKALKQAPLALDIYTWMTYRASYLKQASVIPWESLAMQFGSDYKRTRDFKAAFQHELKKVLAVYAGAQVEATDEGLLVKPSLTHINRKSMT